MVTALYLCGILKNDILTIISLATFSTSVGFNKANDKTIFIREENQTCRNFRNENVTNELLYLREEILGIETFPLEEGGKIEDFKSYRSPECSWSS